LYFGTPVVVLSTRNSVENLRRTGEAVINLPSDKEAEAVDRLALASIPEEAYKKEVVR
jgi:flavin reductase (DIM6/NTAB) family NADH-FMN oxidoreductase RutF